MLLCIFACDAAPQADLVIRAGRLEAGAGSTTQLRKRIVVHDGVIAAITEERDGDDVADTVASRPRVLDARAHTVMPGQVAFAVRPWDNCMGARCAWVHGPAVADAATARGITTLALFDTPMDSARVLRAFVGTGRHRGPRLWLSGPAIAAATPDAATHAATQAIASGVDCLALAPMPAEPLCAATQTAQQASLVAHLLLNESDTTTPSACGARALRIPREPNWRDELPNAERAAARAGALGLGEALGRLQVGYRADLIAVDTSGRVVDVVIDGVPQHRRQRWLQAVGLIIETSMASLQPAPRSP